VLLTPLYDTPSFLRMEVPAGDPGVLLVRQRQRLAALLGGLEDEQWSVASRCEGWTVKDVVTHLVSTNQFWAFSIDAARQGEPTRFLSSFDPVASPAQLVDAARSQTAADVLADFAATTDALATTVAGIEGDGWSILGEAPPGHVPLRAVALHALWDSWVHERDIVLPLGLAPVEEPDEIVDCLSYAALLSPALAVAGGSTRNGSIAIDVTEPDAQFVVEVGDAVLVRPGQPPDDALHLAGRAVELLEALSFREPLPCRVAEEHRWLVSGLARVFDLEV